MPFLCDGYKNIQTKRFLNESIGEQETFTQNEHNYSPLKIAFPGKVSAFSTDFYSATVYVFTQQKHSTSQ